MAQFSQIMFDRSNESSPSGRTFKVGPDQLIFNNVIRYKSTNPLFGRSTLAVYLKSGEILHYD